jgi:glycosyltransferase involved in cell wall biosynthesis
MSAAPPLVSIATPVFNGEAYLAECIESVLCQTHRHLDYHIVNNCSTDGTRDIAERYARQDSRIRVHNCVDFVGMIENHNRALGLVSPESKYCKILSADDWLYPEFVARTLEVAEANPSVGIVGSYQLSGGGDRWRVRWTGLPHHRTVIAGREICRHTLLGGRYVFGVPTSTLYRASIVIGSRAFYPNLRTNADVSSFYEHLQDWDFGFVHQVLSYERIHESATTSGRRKINTYRTDALREFLQYGPIYLAPEEFERRREELLDDFYDLLALGVVNFRGRDFWAYQKNTIRELGYPFLGLRTGRAVLNKVADLLLNPKQTATKVLRRFTHRGAVSLGDGISD